MSRSLLHKGLYQIVKNGAEIKAIRCKIPFQCNCHEKCKEFDTGANKDLFLNDTEDITRTKLPPGMNDTEDITRTKLPPGMNEIERERHKIRHRSLMLWGTKPI